ncbi:6-phosphogluconolactonase [Rhodococcus sp. HNM0569]|uniref:6-phosphogluconolactonase n=1 Tax=Rhodococcus sp. HNM0569 TaxID=2716340 RepID=UPI00146C06B5|nr:6-phosphogluconolactonase [Rhodococcus sp. HNM0569]NLU81224.1 6-phosphogluconolactonase [Rhodococcus sp. HNM0569]
MTVHIDVYDDLDALTTAAARRLADTLIAAQAQRGSASIVLTGGGAGIGTLRALRRLAEHADGAAIDWRSIDIYWGDERFVAPDDPERNELQAREALLDHVDVDPARVHPIAAVGGEFADDADAAARAYAGVLSRHGQPVPEFDVHLLGIGGEGHVNSLFPHTDAVRERHAPVVAVLDSPKPPAVRVTLTLPAVRAAREVWLLAAGAEKADAVAAAVGGADPDDIPAAGAVGSAETRWFLDTAAAGALPEN